MLELYLNTTTREWFDADGNPFSSRMPEMSYKSRETVLIYPKLSTPDAGEVGVSPTLWPNDDNILTAKGIGAILTVDNDFTHKLKGSLTADVASGEAYNIFAKIDNSTQALIPANGTLRLFDKYGNVECVHYNSRKVEADRTVLFELSADTIVTGTYAVNDRVDIDQAPYCQAYFDPGASDLIKGYFAFHLTVDSARLREEMDYTSVDFLPIAGLEVLFYTVDANGAQEPMKAFLLDTFSITGVIGNLGYEGEMPDPVLNQIAAMVGSLTRAGLDVEQRQGSNGTYEIRTKLASLGDDSWSEWVVVGQQLIIQYSADKLSWNNAPVQDTQYVRMSTDGGISWSEALAFGKGNTGEKGEKGDKGDKGDKGEQGEKGEKGDKGDRGESFSPTVIGATENKVLYDNEPTGFSFLDTTLGLLYFKQSDSAGDWSEGMPFGKGEKGDKGDKGDTGSPGYTPVKGTDYFTAEDKEELLDELGDRLLNGEWGTEV